MERLDEHDNGEELVESLFVARQPIFDTSMKVWGYELLYRHAAGALTAEVGDGDAATAKIIVDGVIIGRAGLLPVEKTLVNFPSNLLLKGFGFALPPENCIIEILESVLPTPEVLKALYDLKAAGYTLALDDFVGQPELEPFLDLADIVKVDVLDTPAELLPKIAARLVDPKRLLLAEKVENREMVELTKSMGFNLFQGYFFCRPEIVQGRRLSSSQVSKLRLLQELADEDFDSDKVCEIIESDLSISYRLLRYINSASFGRSDAVDDIHQAMLILGQRNLSKWLQAVVMSDINPSAKGRELVFMSVRRAKFLEMLGRKLRHPPLRPDSLFMLGLFSLLDSLLGQPMEDVLKELPLSTEIREALKGEHSAGRDFLGLAEDMEHADWKAAQDFMNALQLPTALASALNSDALRFAGEMVRDVCVIPPTDHGKKALSGRV